MSKNLHLHHAAENMFVKGERGATEAIEALVEVTKILSGKGGDKFTVTTKYDGAPAILAGTDPEDGRFFVSKKGNNPKLIKSKEDAYNFHSGGLADKLAQAFEHLSKIQIKGVLQADLMFTRDDLKTETIDGKQYVSFRGNTITYSAESHTDLAKQIKKAKIGVVFHTMYTGDTIPTMHASFKVPKNAYKHHDDVWIRDVEYKNVSGKAGFNASEMTKFNAMIRKAEGSLKKTRGLLNKIQSGKKPLKFDTEFMKFFNSYVRQGRPVPSVDIAFKDFYHHMGKEYGKKIDKLKQPSSQASYANKYVYDVIAFLDDHKDQVKMIIATYMNIEAATQMIVDKMKKVKSMSLFVDMGNGNYKVTNDEGYVAIANGTNAIKLVDRLEFSKLNFTVPKNW